MEAVREAIDRYGGLVWSLVRSARVEASLADDVTQEVFISLWKAAARFDPERGSERVFVTTIARRRLIDRYRGSRRDSEVTSLEEPVLVETDPGLASVETRDEAELAKSALEHLKPEQKRLLEMWVVGGMTHTEIATSTGIPLGTVKSQIRRGLIRVRDLLQRGSLVPSPEVSG